MKICLTQQSVEVLEKACTIQKWKVNPPMSKRGCKPSVSDQKVQSEQKQAKVKTSKTSSKNKPIQHHFKKPKLVKDKPAKSAPPAGTFDETTIRKGKNGHQVIKEVMGKLLQADEKTFGGNPAFTPEGMCRLPVEGAKLISWEAIVDAAPLAFESMYLGVLDDNEC